LEDGHLKDEDVDERPNESLMKCLGSLDQHKEIMPEETNETQRSHGFETNCLCVIVGYASDEDKQPLEVVIKKEEDEGLPHKGIEERQTQKYVIREEETTLFHKRSQMRNYT
jgi:hypothetical protein